MEEPPKVDVAKQRQQDKKKNDGDHAFIEKIILVYLKSLKFLKIHVELTKVAILFLLLSNLNSTIWSKINSQEVKIHKQQHGLNYDPSLSLNL